MPSPARSQEIHYEGDEHEIWLGEISNGFKVGPNMSITFHSIIKKIISVELQI